MATVASLLVRIATDISSFESGMNEASSTLENVGKKMGKVGKSLTKKVTLPLLGLGIAAVKIGSDFDSQMSKVSAISGAVGKDFDMLRQQARDLGATTSFSAVEAAEGMEFLARAGFEVDEVMSAMPSVLSLSAAGALDLASAADITSNVLSGFGMEASRAADVADVLALASASSNTNVEQLGTAMSFVAPLAKSLGVSMEEASAAVGIFSDAGIQGTRAGTALRGGLTRLVKPSKQAKKVMKDLGFEAFDQQGNFIGLEKVVGRLEKSTASMTQEQKSQAVATIFGQEAMSGWLALLDRGSVDLKTFTTELENSGGAAAKMAKIMKENLTGKLEILKSTLYETAIGISDLLSPSIEEFVENLTKLIQKFNSLDAGTKKTILLFLGMFAAIGPLLVGLSLLIKGFAVFKTVLGIFSALSVVFGVSLGAVFAFIAGAAALVVAAIWVIKNWDKVVKFFKKDIPKMYKKALEATKKFIDDSIEWFKNLPEKIGYWLGVLVQKGSEKIGELFVKMKEWFGKISALGATAAKKMVDWFIENSDILPDKLFAIFGKIVVFLGLLPIRLGVLAFKAGVALVKGFLKGLKGFKAGYADAMAGFVGPKLPEFEKKLGVTIPSPTKLSAFETLKSLSQRTPVQGGPIGPTRTAAAARFGDTPQLDKSPFSINVTNMNVRDEQDTEKIAQELYRLQQNKMRVSGLTW